MAEEHTPALPIVEGEIPLDLPELNDIQQSDDYPERALPVAATEDTENRVRHTSEDTPDAGTEALRRARDGFLYGKVYYYLKINDQARANNLIVNSFGPGQLTEYLRYEQEHDAMARRRAQAARSTIVPTSSPASPATQPEQRPARVHTARREVTPEAPVVETLHRSVAAVTQPDAAALPISPRRHAAETRAEQGERRTTQQAIGTVALLPQRRPASHTAADHSEGPLAPIITLPVAETAPAAPEVRYAPELNVRRTTFEDARDMEKLFSDSFIDGTISGDLIVETSTGLGVKEFFDSVKRSEADERIVTDPAAVGRLYEATSLMLARNLKVFAKGGLSEREHSQIRVKREEKVGRLRDEAKTVGQVIADAARKKEPAPYGVLSYYGRMWYNHDASYRPNIKMQTNVFIMGYTDRRIREKLESGLETEMTKRIYLNPKLEARSDIFEKLLEAANAANLSLQLKFHNPTLDAMSARHDKYKNFRPKTTRGDGIVVYVGNKDANAALQMVLAVASDNVEAFVGQPLSKLPQKVAEAIAIGDEPIQAPYGDPESLTSDRAGFLRNIGNKVRESGLKGEAARDLFRRLVAADAPGRNIDPYNIAFNARSTRQQVAA